MAGEEADQSSGLAATRDPAALAAYVDVLRKDARAAARASRAPATQRAYASDWRSFRAFAEAIGRRYLPAEAETVALYVRHLAADHKAATISRHLATIAVYHGAAGFDSPTHDLTVRAVLRGTRRQLGVAPEQKKALSITDLEAVVATLSPDLRGLRDRAVILVGWTGALRRSELAALRVRDVCFSDAGALITIGRSKRDQEGAGAIVAIRASVRPDLCPIEAFEKWLVAAQMSTGPVFRSIDRHGRVGIEALSSAAVAEIIKARAAAAGLDSVQIAGHSLRSGFATAAAAAGVSERTIMRHGRWSSAQTARRYIRSGDIWTEAPQSVL